MLCLTATCTARVLPDIQQTLQLGECVIYSGPLNRRNLVYSIVNKHAAFK